MPPVRLEVLGKVQGVGFRWYVRESARRLGIRGWVRNREDGSVEITADGREESLRVLEEAVWKGPPGAIVEAVRKHPVNGAADLPNSFAILR